MNDIIVARKDVTSVVVHDDSYHSKTKLTYHISTVTVTCAVVEHVPAAPSGFVVPSGGILLCGKALGEELKRVGTCFNL